MMQDERKKNFFFLNGKLDLIEKLSIVSTFAGCAKCKEVKRGKKFTERLSWKCLCDFSLHFPGN